MFSIVKGNIMQIYTIICTLLCVLFFPGYSQDSSNSQTGIKLAGIPNLKFDADDGFTYGARISTFLHGKGGYNPYWAVIDLQVALTTRGKKEAFIFFDSPFALGNGQRLTGEMRYEKNTNAPFYGFGRGAFDENLSLETADDFISEDYYRFERERITGWVNFQQQYRRLRLLAGANINHTSVGFLEENTLLDASSDQTRGFAGGFTNGVRLGAIYDSRDFEPAPRSGLWSEMIVERYDKLLGSDYAFTRLTASHRHYLTLGQRVVFAQRIIASRAWGNVPFFATAFFAGSFRIEEGVGGSKSVRGVLKNRAIGQSQVFSNTELRFDLFEFGIFGQQFGVGINAFYDAGSGWGEKESFVWEELQQGYGLGGKLAWNQNFIISVDLARGDEVDSALYIGIGYLF